MARGENGHSEFLTSALRKRDESAVDVLASSSDVKLYNYEQEKNKWNDRGLEGTLYFYRRTGNFGFGLLLLARDSVHSWNERFDQNVELQLRSPFLLYRSSQEAHGRIDGLRFSHKESCEAFYQKIKTNLASGSNGLSYAQKLTGAQPVIVPPVVVAPVLHPVAPVVEVPVPDYPVTIQTLLSPRKPIPYGRQTSQPAPSPEKSAFRPPILQVHSPSAYLNLSATTYSQNGPLSQKAPMPSPHKVDVHQASTDQLRQFLRLNDPPPVLSNQHQNGIPLPLNTQVKNGVSAEKFVRDVTEKLNAIVKPEAPTERLRSPGDFDLPTLLLPDDMDVSTTVSPLNREQMVQALDWMLHNDAGFVDRLHDAYLRSQSSRHS